MKSHRALVPLGILALGALLSAVVIATRPRVVAQSVEVLAPLVRVTEVLPRNLVLKVRGHGTVVPRSESDLVPQVSGEVVWVSPALAPGGFFDAGEPLLRIDPTDYELALEAAAAAAARAESEVVKSRKELERQRRLAESEAASEARIDQVENAFRGAKAGLREAGARRQRAERDLARTELRAPYTGRVREENVDVGQFASRGAPLAKLYAVDFAEVRVPVPDRELAYLDLPLAYRDGKTSASEGPRVELRAEFAGTEHRWTGRLVRTEGEIDPRSRTVTVVARVEEPYARSGDGARPPLAVGLFVDVEIEGRQVERAVVLPRLALREGNHVYVVDDDDRLRIRAVEVLREDRDEVVITAGLAAGERVTLSPLRGAVDGMVVRVAEEPAELARSRS
ncbi:MAG: efflux RND transporter periplasmic adaptor subunit [Myxococcales bacterium]|nr:efflux RND transporter periplasmic adaptor subunit [Myxococcales bacterium]